MNATDKTHNRDFKKFHHRESTFNEANSSQEGKNYLKQGRAEELGENEI